MKKNDKIYNKKDYLYKQLSTMFKIMPYMPIKQERFASHQVDLGHILDFGGPVGASRSLMNVGI